jgi:hypothetical protein
MSNPANKFINAFTKKFTALSQDIVDELQDSLTDASPSEVKSIINAVWGKYDVPQQYQDLLLDGIVGSVRISADVPNVTLFKDYYLKNVKCVDDIRLSSKINDVTRTTEIKAMIKDALTVKDKWQTVSTELVSKGITQAEFPKYMDDLVQLSRQGGALSGDMDIARAYQKALSRANGQIEKLINPDSSTLKRAYKDVVELSENASAKAFDSAVERAIMFKARSNAERLAKNEINRAYGNSRLLELKSNGEEAVQVSLSGDHRDIGCICEYIVEQDFGLGAGVYPISKLPEYPFHPNCDCILDDSPDDIDISDFDDNIEDDSDYDWDYNKLYLDDAPIEVE